MFLALFVVMFATAFPKSSSENGCSKPQTILDSIAGEIGNGGALTISKAQEIQNVAVQYADKYRECKCSESLEEIIFDMSLFIEEKSDKRADGNSEDNETKGH